MHPGRGAAWLLGGKSGQLGPLNEYHRTFIAKPGLSERGSASEPARYVRNLTCSNLNRWSQPLDRTAKISSRRSGSRSGPNDEYGSFKYGGSAVNREFVIMLCPRLSDPKAPIARAVIGSRSRPDAPP